MIPMVTSLPAGLDNPLWRYALAFYRQPGVAPACLALQDRLGVDVCLLIYALYAAQSQRVMNAAALTQADQGVQDWRKLVVLPLRQIRQSMKSGVSEMAPDLNNWVREQVKVMEVNAEQVALAYLNTQILCLPQSKGFQDQGLHEAELAMRCVLTHFAELNGHSNDTLNMTDVRIAAELLVNESLGLQQFVNDNINHRSKD